MVHIVLCIFLASSAVRYVSGQLKHKLLPCAPEGRAVWGTPCFLAALFVICVEVCCRVWDDVPLCGDLTCFFMISVYTYGAGLWERLQLAPHIFGCCIHP